MAIYKFNQHSTESEPSSITKTDDSEVVLCIPLDPENTDYAEILRKVKEEGLTIQDAD
tara:strand:- start:34 stop:207 length:174 start_codon:yes stop_codon:yes gene_type:complete